MSGKELSGIRLIRRRGSCSHAARLAGGTFINCFGGVLQKPEVYFDSGEDGDRLAILQSGLESPLRDSLDRFLVQTEAQRSHHFDIFRTARLIDDDRERDRALPLGFARFFRIFVLHFAEHARRRDASADAVRATAAAAAQARAHPSASARSDAATRAAS